MQYMLGLHIVESLAGTDVLKKTKSPRHCHCKKLPEMKVAAAAPEVCD